MLLSLTTTHTPATDLGFLLHKNPARVHERALSFGKARVIYSEASDEKCQKIGKNIFPLAGEKRTGSTEAR
ncbi:MAG: hypothetical protein ABIP97_01975 [Chthoniobacterales bacterium]